MTISLKHGKKVALSCVEEREGGERDCSRTLSDLRAGVTNASNLIAEIADASNEQAAELRRLIARFELRRAKNRFVETSLKKSRKTEAPSEEILLD